MLETVPIEFLALIYQAIGISDSHTTTEMPKFHLVIVPGSICLDIGLDVKVLVELFKEDTFLESPA